MGETIGIIILDGVIGIVVAVGVAFGTFERIARPLWSRWQNRRWAQMSEERRKALTAQ